MQGIKHWSPEKRQWAGLSLAALLAFFISLAVFTIPLVNALEWKIVDSWIYPRAESIPNKDVAVIGIDQDFLKQFEWPIEKNLYGELLFYLNEMGAKVIGIDVLFSNDINRCDQGDSIFLQELKDLPNIVLIFSPNETLDPSSSGPLVIPEKYATGKGQITGHTISDAVFPYGKIVETGVALAHHNLAQPFKDGAYRMLPMFVSSHGLIYPAFSLLCASRFNDSARMDWDRAQARVTLGKHAAPVDENTNLVLDFRQKVDYYTMNEIFGSLQSYLKEETPKIGRDQLAGKIILIGASDPLLGDNATTVSKQGGTVPKVMLHALGVATLLNDTGTRNLGRPFAAIFSAVLLLILLLVFKLRQGLTGYLSVLALAIGAYYGGQYLYYSGFLLPIGEGLGAALLFTLFASLIIFFEKDDARSFLFDSFKTYLSQEVIEDMYQRRVKPQLGGSEGVHTAFFTDIQSFSTFSEEIGSPTKLVELLNEYLSAMTDILIENHGTLDKYIGDAIVAFFGAPMEMPDHAFKACNTALMMQAKLAELQKKWKAEGDKWPEIVHAMRMRIGISTGPIVTGNMGSHVRMNYTMMGDTVNLAARLESGAKQYGAYSLISQSTFDQVQDRIFCRKIDVIQVVGKAEPVAIYEILSLQGKVPETIKKCAEYFELGRAAYIGKNWDAAIGFFEQSMIFEPNHPDRSPGSKTTPSHVFIKRCKAYKTTPPPAGWDGIFMAKEK